MELGYVKTVGTTVKLWWLLVDTAVDPADWAEKRSGEGELNAIEARQFGGFWDGGGNYRAEGVGVVKEIAQLVKLLKDLDWVA